VVDAELSRSAVGPVTRATVAALAAAAATAGDLLLLWAGNAARPELALPRPPAGVLRVGMWLGTLAMPL
jgi:hypothetical protein